MPPGVLAAGVLRPHGPILLTSKECKTAGEVPGPPQELFTVWLYCTCWCRSFFDPAAGTQGFVRDAISFAGGSKRQSLSGSFAESMRASGAHLRREALPRKLPRSRPRERTRSRVKTRTLRTFPADGQAGGACMRDLPTAGPEIFDFRLRCRSYLDASGKSSDLPTLYKKRQIVFCPRRNVFSAVGNL